MSKHKKRVATGQHTADQLTQATGGAATTAKEPIAHASLPAEVEPVEDDALAGAPELPEDAGDERQAADEQAQEGPGIETHPLFWFVLGALTVGIMVLLGLLLMGSGAAAPVAKTATKPAATATNQAVRPTTPTPASRVTTAPTPTMPDYSAIMTAQAEENESVPRMSIEETKQKLDAGAILVVDVRSMQSYTEQHIKGAINVPEPDTEARLKDFPKDREIVLYCA